MTPTDLCAAISGLRFDLTSEKRTQADMSGHLTSLGIGHLREVRLKNEDGEIDIPDFIVGTIVLEVKAFRAARAGIVPQLERYAAYEHITAIVLASNRQVILPETINGKPVYFVSTSTAWI